MIKVNSKITPFLTFHGNAEDAMNYYVSILPDCKIESVVYFEDGGRGDPEKVMTGVLSVMGQQFMFMDMNAEYDCPVFSWSTSFYLQCKDEAEFDSIFDGFAKDGLVMMKEDNFMQFKKVAWVTDKYGITWQPVL